MLCSVRLPLRLRAGRKMQHVMWRSFSIKTFSLPLIKLGRKGGTYNRAGAQKKGDCMTKFTKTVFASALVVGACAFTFGTDASAYVSGSVYERSAYPSRGYDPYYPSYPNNSTIIVGGGGYQRPYPSWGGGYPGHGGGWHGGHPGWGGGHGPWGGHR